MYKTRKPGQLRETFSTYQLVQTGCQSFPSVGRLTEILKRGLVCARYTLFFGVHQVELWAGQYHPQIQNSSVMEPLSGL